MKTHRLVICITHFIISITMGTFTVIMNINIVRLLILEHGMSAQWQFAVIPIGLWSVVSLCLLGTFLAKWKLCGIDWLIFASDWVMKFLYASIGILILVALCKVWL